MTNPKVPSDAELDRLICLFTREPSVEFSFEEEQIVAALRAAKETGALRWEVECLKKLTMKQAADFDAEVAELKKRIATLDGLRKTEGNTCVRAIERAVKLRAMVRQAEPLISDLHPDCSCPNCLTVRRVQAECKQAIVEEL